MNAYILCPASGHSGVDLNVPNSLFILTFSYTLPQPQYHFSIHPHWVDEKLMPFQISKHVVHPCFILFHPLMYFPLTPNGLPCSATKGHCRILKNQEHLSHLHGFVQAIPLTWNACSPFILLILLV